MQCTESVHVAACKRFLNVPKYACTNSVLGDLARFLYIYIVVKDVLSTGFV